MRTKNWGRGTWLMGAMLVGTSWLACDVDAGELRHRMLPPKCTPAPVEPAPPNAGYYPTWWNRWDTEAAYLPGLRRPEGPPESKREEDVSSAPGGEYDPLPPLGPPSTAPRPTEPAPRPPANQPKPVAPAPVPPQGNLPPLPDGTAEPAPLPAPAPSKPSTTEPAPDLFQPPPQNGTPSAPPVEKAPGSPEPMELPEPMPLDMSPKTEPRLPDLDQPKSSEPAPPKSDEAPQKPTDDLFEAPPRGGSDRNSKQGAVLPPRSPLYTTIVKGEWTATGGSRSNLEGQRGVVAPASGQQDAASHTKKTELWEPVDESCPARLPADTEAAPLSVDASAHTRQPVGAASARITTVRDSSVRAVQWIETAPSGLQPMLNPLRRK